MDPDDLRLFAPVGGHEVDFNAATGLFSIGGLLFDLGAIEELRAFLDEVEYLTATRD